MWYALDVLHVICTQFCPGHLSIVFVGNSLWHSEEIVKKFQIAPLNAISSSSSSSMLKLYWNYDDMELRAIWINRASILSLNFDRGWAQHQISRDER